MWRFADQGGVLVQGPHEPVLAQTFEGCSSHALDLLWPLLEPVVFGIGHLSVQVRPLLPLLKINVTVSGKFEATNLGWRQINRALSFVDLLS